MSRGDRGNVPVLRVLGIIRSIPINHNRSIFQDPFIPLLVPLLVVGYDSLVAAPPFAHDGWADIAVGRFTFGLVDCPSFTLESRWLFVFVLPLPLARWGLAISFGKLEIGSFFRIREYAPARNDVDHLAHKLDIDG